jgi:RNA-directed DNA polymerase
LVKAFLKAGVLTQEHIRRDTTTGTPQGGILSPLLANVALCALDERFMGDWEAMMATRVDRARRRHHGLVTYRLVRYADDFLGFRIRRDRKRGTNERFVYTYPAKKALASIKAKVRAITRQGTNHPLSSLLRQLNLVLRGWTTHFRHAVSSATFGYLHQFTWVRVVRRLRRKHPRANWRQLRRRYLRTGWWPEQDGVMLFDPARVAVTRYRFRGASIPSPWEWAMD